MMRKWYWVKLPGGEWFPATRCAGSAGGWTNLDTWEDWGHEVLESVEIRPPMDAVTITVTAIDRVSHALHQAQTRLAQLHLLAYLADRHIPKWLARLVVYCLPSRIILWWSKRLGGKKKGEI